MNHLSSDHESVHIPTETTHTLMFDSKVINLVNSCDASCKDKNINLLVEDISKLIDETKSSGFSEGIKTLEEIIEILSTTNDFKLMSDKFSNFKRDYLAFQIDHVA